MDYIRDDISDELNAPQVRTRSSKFSMRSGERVFPILSMERDGFTIAGDTPPALRGFVDILQAGDRIARCLIFCISVEDGVVRYGFKRMTADAPPAPTDFVEDRPHPVALLN